MNLLVTLDSNYVHPLTVLLRSVMLSDPSEVYDVYVAHASLTREDFRRIENAVDPTRTRIHPITIPEETLAHAPVLKRLTKASYYRLLAVDFMPEDTDRVLYLDPDIVVVNPLRPLYETELNGALLAAAGHTTGLIEKINRRRLRLQKGTRYINSGVLLMDIAAMRRTFDVEQIFRFIEENAGRITLGDQDVFNAFFTGHIKILDERLYNLDEKTYALYQKQEGMDPIWVRGHTVIIHYNGKYKPWLAGYRGELQGFYHELDMPFPLTVGHTERTVRI